MSMQPTGIKTVTYILHNDADWQSGLQAAVQALRRGELVAFPTETVYGLGADALKPDAVASIFVAKGRPQDNPLIVHVPDEEAVLPLVRSVPPVFHHLASHFWPGPLTMILPKAPHVPPETTAGLDSVAIRVPNHPIAQALLRASGIPVAAPSANRSGRPSPTLAEHVLADLDGQVAVLLDGGPTGVGVESTVLDLTQEIPTVLRPGGVTLEQLRAAVGDVALDPRATALPGAGAQVAGPVRSPGMKYRHYAPAAPTVLVEGRPPQVWERLKQLVCEIPAKKPGLLLTDDGAAWFGQHGMPAGAVVCTLGPLNRPDEAARRIFAALRQLDAVGVDRIFIEGVPTEGIGLAVMNRLRRAAGGQIVQADTM